MTEEQITKNDEDKEEKEDKKEDKEKSTIESSISALTDTIKGFEGDLRTKIDKIGDTVDKFDTRIGELEKALEEPTDLPLKPKVTAEDDIGAKTKVPDTYQSNSQQANIRDADDENSTENDKGGLAMQEKSKLITKSEQQFTTETPRPGGTIENIEKSQGPQRSEVLKACREVGFEDLGQVGRKILNGDFGSPDDSEVARW